MGKNTVFQDNLQGTAIRISRDDFYNLIREIKAKKIHSSLSIKKYIQGILENPPEVKRNYFMIDYLELKKGFLYLTSSQLLLWLMLAHQMSCPQDYDRERNMALYKTVMVYANYEINNLVAKILSPKTVQTAMGVLWTFGFIIATRPMVIRFGHKYPVWCIKAVGGLKRDCAQFFSSLIDSSNCIYSRSVNTLYHFRETAENVPEKPKPAMPSPKEERYYALQAVYEQKRLEKYSLESYKKQFKDYFMKMGLDPKKCDYELIALFFFQQRDYKGKKYENPVGAWVADGKTKTQYLHQHYYRWRYRYFKGETNQDRMKKKGFDPELEKEKSLLRAVMKGLSTTLFTGGAKNDEIKDLLDLRESTRKRVMRLEEGAITAKDFIIRHALEEDGDQVRLKSKEIVNEKKRICSLNEQLDEYELGKKVQHYCALEGGFNPYPYDWGLIVRYLLLHKNKYGIFNRQLLGEWLRKASDRQNYHSRRYQEWYLIFIDRTKRRGSFFTEIINFCKVVDEVYEKLKADPDLGAVDFVRDRVFSPPPPPKFILGE